MPKILLAVGSLATLAAMTGCAGNGKPSATPSQSPPPSSSITPSGPTTLVPPSSASASPSGNPPDELIIVVRSGSGPAVTWRLTCNPPGGDHPDPETACRVLEQNGERALPAVPRNRMCTQVYSGPERATISGTWRGKPVLSHLARNNGCETARWKALIGLLPEPGLR